jgi:hypothetical protein
VIPPTDTPEPAPALFTVSQELYEHPSGSFSFYPPEGWELTETAFDATFAEPNGNGSVYISVTNTGYELDEASLANFVNASEGSYFATYFEEYNQVSNDYYPETKSIQVVKTLTYNGTPWTVVSIYLQEGQAIIEVTFWIISADHVDAYVELLVDMNLQEGSASDLFPYAFSYTFTDKNSFFQFDVPFSWGYEYVEDGDVYIDTFSSPDGNAAIQDIVYDAGETMNQGVAGEAALSLLNSFYTSGSGDIKISKDEIQPDGSEKLTWTSKKGGYSGVTFFESRGTYLILFTMFADDELFALFDLTFGNVISTYKVP